MTSSLTVTRKQSSNVFQKSVTGTYIEYVTMVSMEALQKTQLDTILPQAKVVVDKFHVVRMANQAL